MPLPLFRLLNYSNKSSSKQIVSSLFCEFLLYKTLSTLITNLINFSTLLQLLFLTRVTLVRLQQAMPPPKLIVYFQDPFCCYLHGHTVAFLRKNISTMRTQEPRQVHIFDAMVSPILRSLMTPNLKILRQVSYRSSLKLQQTGAVSPSSDGSHHPDDINHSICTVVAKGDVVKTIDNNLHCTASPGQPPCRKSAIDNHLRIKLKARQNTIFNIK